jgi:predicted DNA-binding transcriptional regulator YafY
MEMSVEIISAAIFAKRLIRFCYTGDSAQGFRIVEPHMLAYNTRNKLVLSGWLQAGASSSGGQGWREFLVASICEIELLDETFKGPRPGYRPDGGQNFHTIQYRI